MKSSCFFCVYTILVAALLILGGIAVPVSAQGVNDEAVLLLDFQTTSEDSQNETAVEETPEFTGEEDQFFSATLVLTGVQDFVGFNCDLLFDPEVLRVVEIHEARGDMNFDGRSNIADVLAVAERLGEEVSEENGYDFFNREIEGESGDVIDIQDVNAILPHLNERNLFWTSNPNHDLNKIRESVEIFEDPAVIQQRIEEGGRGMIDDIVVVLLPRERTEEGFVPEGFGFNGDARIADITFEIIGGESGDTTEISFENVLAVDESTRVTTAEITDGSEPQAPVVTITLP